MTTTIIKLNNLTKRYGKATVVDKFNLEVEQGSICGLIGPNGAGKTTIMKMMAGLTNTSGGTMEFFGQKGNGITSSRMSFMIENPMMDINMTARQNMDYIRILKGIADPKKTEELLKFVGLSDVIDKKAKTFSLGMRQRLGIAMALLSDPEILVLDEPESGLDFRNQIAVLDLIRRLCSEKNLTAVMNTHYPDHALRISDQALVLMGGGMHLYGRTRAILTKEHLRAAFGVEIALQTETIGSREYSSVIPLELLDKNESAFF